MTHAEFADTAMTEHRLAALERRYLNTLDALTSARASHASLSELTIVDELEVRRALGKVQHLQGKLADLQTAMEILEDGVSA